MTEKTIKHVQELIDLSDHMNKEALRMRDDMKDPTYNYIGLKLKFDELIEYSMSVLETLEND